MKIKSNKIRQKFIAGFFIASIIALVFLSITSIFRTSIHQNVYADGLSPEDALLAKTLRHSIYKCIMNNVLKPKNTVTVKTNDAFYDVLFDSANQYFKDEKAVNILYKYGTGNTVEDGNISCHQLLYGYNNTKESNSFAPFPKMGGKFPDTSKTAEMNTFLESLGYTEVKNGSSDVYCATIVYRVTINSVGQDKQTVPICISARNGVITGEDGTSATVPKIYLQKNNSGDYVQFVTDVVNGPTPGSFGIAINTPQKANSCKINPVPVQVDSGYLNTNLAMPQYNAKDFFRSFIKKVASVDLGAIPINNGVCEHKTLAQAIADDNSTNGARIDPSNVTVKVDETKSYEATDDLNGTRSTKNDEVRTYKNTGSPDLNKIMDFLLPSYSKLQRSNIYETTLNAYNWYHILKDTFGVISVDGNIGCKTEKPKTGVYLPYYRESKTEPGKNELVYCPLDEMTLDSKNGVHVMTDAPLGVVNGVAEDGFNIEQLTARKALEYLNKVDLPAICAADSSFPLCNATPIDCKTDPNKEGCKDLAGSNASEEEDSANGESAACFANAGALGWIICPLIYTLRDAAQGIFSGFIEPLLRVHDSIIGELTKNNESSTMYQAWSFFRNVGNILFVIALLFVIFSQVTGFGIDNYGIKKILPKLIVTAIIVNFSYIICGVLVDISNILGNSIKNIFESVGGSLTAGSKSGDGLGPVGYITSIVAIIGTIVAAGAGVAVAGSIISSGGLLTILVPILTFLASAVIAGFFAMLMLGIRQALVIIMIVISPIAFVLYAIPNTNAIFRRWFTLFRGLLTLYPVYCLMVGGGFMAANLIVHGSNEFYLQLVAGLISIAPYFAVPTMTKNAMKGFDAAIGGIATLRSRASSGLQYANKKVTGSDSYKASVANREFGKQSKFAKKYEGYTQEQLSNMKPAQRRRLMNAIGVLGKDAQQAATLGAAMSQYKYNTDTESMKRASYDAMTAEDENQVKSLQSQYASKNLSIFDTISQLEKAQSHDYSSGTVEENRQNDLNLRALQRHLLSTKEGQKTYNDYLAGMDVYEDYRIGEDGKKVGIGEKISAQKSSNRARAVLSRDFVSNNSNLKDSFGATYTQMQLMQGSGNIESMKDNATASMAISNSRASAIDKYVGNMDSKDMQNLSKADARELTRLYTETTTDADGNTVKVLSPTSSDKIKQLSNQIVNIVSNDPTKLGDYNDNLRGLVSTASGTDINNLGNRTMEIRDSSGNVTHKIVWERPGQGGQGNGGQGGQGNGDQGDQGGQGGQGGQGNGGQGGQGGQGGS